MKKLTMMAIFFNGIKFVFEFCFQFSVKLQYSLTHTIPKTWYIFTPPLCQYCNFSSTIPNKGQDSLPLGENEIVMRENDGKEKKQNELMMAEIRQAITKKDGLDSLNYSTLDEILKKNGYSKLM